MSAARRLGKALGLDRAERDIVAALLSGAVLSRALLREVANTSTDRSLTTRIHAVRRKIGKHATLWTVFVDGEWLPNGSATGSRKCAGYAFKPLDIEVLLELAGPGAPREKISTTITARWRLSPAQTIVADALIEGNVVSREALRAKLHAAGFEPECKKAVDLQVMHTRNRVRPFGMEIESVWGEGWRISDQSRARLAAQQRGRSR